MAKHGNVKEGDIAVTVGGKMKCQCVIHAVGKAFNGQESERVGIRISLVYRYAVHVCIGGYLHVFCIVHIVSLVHVFCML